MVIKDWKEYVWHCTKDYPSAKYDLYWKEGGADLMKDHICTSVQGSVHVLKRRRCKQ